MRYKLRLALLAVLITTVFSSCPSADWKQFRDMCYWGRSDDYLLWRDVADVCNSIYPGAEMVTIHDVELNGFIAEEIAGRDGSKEYAWLGLSRYNSSSRWAWTDGSAYNFSLWYNNDPDYRGEDCAFTNYVQWGMWVGYDCVSGRFYFMCQMPAQ